MECMHTLPMMAHQILQGLAERVRRACGCVQVLQHRVESCQAAGRNVVVTGDLNIAPYPIDHCDFVRAPQRCRRRPPAARPLTPDAAALESCSLTLPALPVTGYRRP